MYLSNQVRDFLGHRPDQTIPRIDPIDIDES